MQDLGFDYSVCSKHIVKLHLYSTWSPMVVHIEPDFPTRSVFKCSHRVLPKRRSFLKDNKQLPMPYSDLPLLVVFANSTGRGVHFASHKFMLAVRLRREWWATGWAVKWWMCSSVANATNCWATISHFNIYFNFRIDILGSEKSHRPSSALKFISS